MKAQSVSVFQLAENQVENLSALAITLDKELKFIGSRQADSLMKLLEDKSTLLEVIQQTDAEIEKAIDKQGNLNPEEEALIEKAKSLLEDCKYRTQVNMKAVEQGQLRLTHLRNLMMEVRAKESLTYDNKGKPKGSSSGSGISA